MLFNLVEWGHTTLDCFNEYKDCSEELEESCV